MTTFPDLGMRSMPPPNDGPVSLEMKIADADLMAIVSLSSVAQAVETRTSGTKTGYIGALKFTFNVHETLIATDGRSLNQVVAMVGSLQAYAQRSDAEARAAIMAAQRDTQWDNRQAVVFLAKSSIEFPGTSSDDLYFMSYIGSLDGLGDGYSLASKRNQLWLPEARTGAGDGGGGTASASAAPRRFLTGVPQQVPSTAPRTANIANDTETPSILLSELKATVTRIRAEQSPSEAYAKCVSGKYEREYYQRVFAARGREYAPLETFESGIHSGLKAGTDVLNDTRKIVVDLDGWEARSTLLGTDAALFRIGETTKTSSGTFGALNSLNAKKEDIRYHWHTQPLETVRPLPSGVYNLIWKYNRAEYVLCDPGYFHNYPITITVTAPSGALHEAFFDPVTDGSAIAADSTNGILKPASFTDTNNASASLQRIEWASGTVKVKVSPHTGL
ncbi:MAG: hypothetical protein OXI33_14725, partial [Chloroflexota bacterium]|nr:hypothetical protein [Chloroflexota bacterium]